MKTLLVLLITLAFNFSYADHHEGAMKKDMGKVMGMNNNMDHDMGMKMDTDKDGKISKDEFIKGHEARFTKMDTDKDGFLTKEEKKTFRKGKKMMRKARKAERRAKRGKGK